ncbi:MAG: KDO2-lipid IV(A) lauroyltransferase [Glaciecola sp.]|jgi:KDO2-lipid IV(A) lauroyltransferase
MAALIYYFTLPLIYLISFLPFKLLYLFSNFLYVLLYKIIGYRKKVVSTNLKNAFPNYSQEQLKLTEKKFYKYFCDLILESLKTLTISPKSLKKHVSFLGSDVFDKFKKEERSVIIVMGHQGNWELGGARFALEPIHQLYVIYHPLKNKYFDKLVYFMRTRLGNRLYAMKDTIRGMLKDRGELNATAFIADQTPSPRGAYWTTFLNQDTPVFTGTAKLSKKLNYPIIYVSVKRERRGLYTMTAELLLENPSDFTENEISELHTKRLEKDIVECPENWLWSHRRWKHQRS